MKSKTGVILAVAILAVFLSTNSVFSEDQTASSGVLSTETSGIEEPQWVWAEVLSVDPVSRQMDIKYLDYETDTEKEMTINADDKTTYENIKYFEEIKPQDTVSIDYVTVAAGKSIAKNINVEKPETQEAQPSEQQSTPSQGQE